MANQGVFTRNLNQLESISRSLQRLEHRHTFTTRYGQIVPNFSEILYPNETLTLKTTNFLRTIPLKTPQLSRVRVFQRFVAVPMRIMWFPWEDYINAPNPASVTPEEPYIANFNSVASVLGSAVTLSQVEHGSHYFTKSDAVSAMQTVNANYVDFSSLGIAYDSKSLTASTVGFARALNAQSSTLNTDIMGYQFFPHELGDYFNAPLFTVSLASDVSSRFSAFKFCAYQMAYDFFYRRPNVEVMTDDIFEMSQTFGNDYISEFPLLHSRYRDGRFVSPIADCLADTSSSLTNAQKGDLYNPSAIFNAIDMTATTPEHCRWENVERFPLKAGANIVMQANIPDQFGVPVFNDSRISLTRMRYAPWLMDRFTSSNPWPQRDAEAMIPVQGSINVTLPNSTTVSFSNLSVDVPSSEVQFLSSSDHSYYGSLAGVLTTAPEGASDGGASAGSTFTVFNATALPAGTLNAFNEALLYSSPTTGTTSGSAQASFSSSSANVEYALSVSPSNFRFYMQLQHIKEMSGMTDGRYKSYMQMFFGSRLRNNQIDYPEFIGGFVQDLDISEIAQTSETSDTPLGTLAGRGVSAKRGSTVRFHAMEHTVILGLIHILPDAEYIGGLSRVDHTTNPFDWVMPQFAGISEQAVRNSELSVHSTTFGSVSNAWNDQAFGYEPRFNELRARHSYVTGAFRDVFNSTGEYQYYKPWLITRNFGFDPDYSVDSNLVTKLTLRSPTLSPQFLSSRGTVDASNFEVTNEQVMYPFMCDSYFDERIARIIPRRGIPRI